MSSPSVFDIHVSCTFCFVLVKIQFLIVHQALLVTFLWLWWNTMTKATYRRTCLVYGSRGSEYKMTGTAWKLATGAGSWEATSLTSMKQKADWKWDEALNSKLIPSYVLPPPRLSMTSPNSSTTNGSNLWGTLPVQASTLAPWHPWSHGDIIMQNTFSPTLKVPIVFHSFSTF